jgi:putative ABC transport system permease protein
MSDSARPSRRTVLDEEIRHHIAECTDFLVSQGWDPEAASVEAARRFGDVRRIKRELEAVNRGRLKLPPTVEWVRSAATDVAYALRGIRGNRTFTAAVVATLALGIGAASAIFAVVDAILVRPLAYRDADRWVEVNHAHSDGGYSPGILPERIPVWQEAAAGLFEGWVAYSAETLVRTDGAQAEALSVVAVTPGAERLLGIPLLMGRGFTAEDAVPGGASVGILSREYWERIGADPEIVGRTIRLESGAVTVVGVLRGGIKFPEYGRTKDLWVPLRDDFTFADRGAAIQGLWARMAPGLTVEAAQERAEVLAEGFEEQLPAKRSWRVRIIPLGEHRANPDVKRALLILCATVGALFLIALVNGVNLILVRSSARAREFSVRAALGASRLRVLRQLVVEGLVIGLLGGVFAVALAWVVVAGIRGILPSEVFFFSPHAFEVEGRTLLFALVASVAAGTALGLVPALQAMRFRNPAGSLGGRGGDEAPDRRRVRNGLVVAQVGLSMTLLVAAGLLVNSFARLLAVDPGYDYQRVAIADMLLSPTRYPDGATRADFARRLEAALEAQPAVQAVTLRDGSGFTYGEALEAEGEPVREDQPFMIPHSFVAEDFFRTTGIELQEGSGVGLSDVGTGNVVIDRDLATFLWGGRPAVGKRFRMGAEGEWWTVAGVAEDLKLMGRDERQGPYQFLFALNPENVGHYVEFWMRTSGRPAELLPVFRHALRSIDPEQWIWKLGTGAQMLAQEEAKPRFVVTLMSLLATIAVTLACVGLYGVLAYSVTRRSRELGIRLALGADRGRLRRMVLGEGISVAGVGVLLGIVGGLWASRLVEQLLYDVAPRDPLTFSATAALFLAVAAAASLLPSLRATRVDPVEVLRAE